jgi:hypothetical protein
VFKLGELDSGSVLLTWGTYVCFQPWFEAENKYDLEPLSWIGVETPPPKKKQKPRPISKPSFPRLDTCQSENLILPWPNEPHLKIGNSWTCVDHFEPRDGHPWEHRSCGPGCSLRYVCVWESSTRHPFPFPFVLPFLLALETTTRTQKTKLCKVTSASS